MKHTTFLGGGVAPSMPGGIFGAAPAPQHRECLDGSAQFKGRANSSSVKGGIFGGADDENTKPQQQRRPEAHKSNGGLANLPYGNSNGGIYGDGFKGGGYGGGYTKPSSSAWDGAAGGKSSNAGQVRDGHFRGGTTNAGAYANGGGGGGMLSARADRAAGGDFLSQLAGAEERDQIESERMSRAAGDEAAESRAQIEEAAWQIAQEQNLDAKAQRQLCETLWNKYLEKSGYFQFELDQPEYEAAPPYDDIVGNDHRGGGHGGGGADPSPRAAGGRGTNAHQGAGYAPVQSSAWEGAAGGYRGEGGRRFANDSSLPGGVFG